MFKILIATLVVFSSLCFAEDITIKEQIEKCEKVYDECSFECDKNHKVDKEECNAKCEMLFDKCVEPEEELEDTKAN